MKTEMVRTRVTDAEKARYIEVAGHEPLSSWVRRVLNAAAGHEHGKPLPPVEGPVVVSSGEDDPLEVRGGEPLIEQLARAAEPEPGPVRRCEQWRNHRAGRFCKTCQTTMPL